MRTEQPSSIRRGELAISVMPDLIRHPAQAHVPFSGFRLGGGNDKSQSDNIKIASAKGEGFQPSPRKTLKKLQETTHEVR
jgi:hypothetical protein